MPDTPRIAETGICPGTRDIIPWFGFTRIPGHLCLAMAAVIGPAVVPEHLIGPVLPASFHARRVCVR